MLTFVVHNVSLLLEIYGVDDFIVTVVFVPVQVFRLTTVTRATASAKKWRLYF